MLGYPNFDNLRAISITKTFVLGEGIPKNFKDTHGNDLVFSDHTLFKNYERLRFGARLSDEIYYNLVDFLDVEYEVVDNRAIVSGKVPDENSVIHLIRGTRIYMERLIGEVDKNFKISLLSLREKLSTEANEERISELQFDIEDLDYSRELIQNSMRLKSINSFVEYITTENSIDYTELKNLANSSTPSVVGLVLLDNIFYCLMDEDQESLMHCFHLAVKWDEYLKKLDEITGFNNSNKIKNYVDKEIAVRNQKRADTRFEQARSFARQWADKVWKENSRVRYGEIARDVHKALIKNPQDVGLSKSPTIPAIKKWIKDLAPSEECYRAGRPKK